MEKSVDGGPVLAEYEYDRGAWGLGQRTGMSDATGETSWGYDALGRTIIETRVLTGGLGVYTTQWTYDLAGRLSSTRYPTGEVVTTTYDVRNLVQSVTGLSQYMDSATYNAAGMVTRQTWGNDLETVYGYRPDNLRLESLELLDQ